MTERLRDKDPIPFGPYRGRLMRDVPAWYFLDIVDQYWISKYPAVKGYIDHNRDQIEDEASKAKNK